MRTGAVKRDAGVGTYCPDAERNLEAPYQRLKHLLICKDRKGLLMAGADRAIRELMFIFKDDPIEVPLEEATMSVWARMQLQE